MEVAHEQQMQQGSKIDGGCDEEKKCVWESKSMEMMVTSWVELWLWEREEKKKKKKKKKGKGGKNSKTNPKGICNYCKKNWVIRIGTVQRKQRNILLLLLFRMTLHHKVIWFWLLVNNYNNILNNGYWT